MPQRTPPGVPAEENRLQLDPATEVAMQSAFHVQITLIDILL
jgi:hypothetical protein